MWLLLGVLMVIDWSSFATEPHPLQKPFIEDCVDPNIKQVVAFTGLQGGKTYAECDGGFAALYGPNPLMLPPGPRGKTPAEVWLVSKSYALAEVLYETFRWRTPPEIWATDADMRRWGISRGDRFTHYLVPRRNCEDKAPIKLRVRTTSDPNAMRATNTLILRIEDEFAWWKELSWQNAQARGIVTDPKIIGGTTPHGKNHAYRDVAVPGGYTFGVKGRHPRRDPRIAVHTWTSEDNPHAKKEVIERLRKIFGKEYAKQELEAAFTDAIGFVFSTFDRDKHMVPLPSVERSDYEKVTGGIDPGWTDPYAGVIWAKYKGDGRWYQVWELYETKKTSDDLAPRFLEAQERWGIKFWQTDKRRPSDINRLQRNGVKAIPNLDIHAEDDRRTIPVMLSVVQGLMQSDRMRIDVSHEDSATEFEKYHYPDPSEDNPKNTNDIPVDWMNHLMDATRYALCAVEEIVAGVMQYKRDPMNENKIIPAYKIAGKPKPFVAPSIAQTLAIQDERYEAAERGLRG